MQRRRAPRLGYRRVVGDDGVIGAELVIALALYTVAKRVGIARIW